MKLNSKEMTSKLEVLDCWRPFIIKSNSICNFFFLNICLYFDVFVAILRALCLFTLLTQTGQQAGPGGGAGRGRHHREAVTGEARQREQVPLSDCEWSRVHVTLSVFEHSVNSFCLAPLTPQPSHPARAPSAGSLLRRPGLRQEGRQVHQEGPEVAAQQHRQRLRGHRRARAEGHGGAARPGGAGQEGAGGEGAPNPGGEVRRGGWCWGAVMVGVGSR